MLRQQLSAAIALLYLRVAAGGESDSFESLETLAYRFATDKSHDVGAPDPPLSPSAASHPQS